MAISRPARADDDVAGKQIKRTIWSGVLAGVGLVAFADETVFHQLLHWHHFYDKSTLAVGLVSDGLFHAGGFIAMVAGRGSRWAGWSPGSRRGWPGRWRSPRWWRTGVAQSA